MCKKVYTCLLVYFGILFIDSRTVYTYDNNNNYNN